MMTTTAAGSIREQLEADEELVLSSFAQKSRLSKGRARPEPPDATRPIFQHDRDRIIHSKAFRRLAGKTQVFLAPEGDHYRTRITHTLEVAQVARTVTRALRLNESLTEAIVMGHDLGHTPFGHAGEKVLAKLMPDGFHHVKQSIRVVEKLERDGEGLNLSVEVRDGILKHSKGKGHIISDNANLMAMTLEGQIVRIADIVAYVNHDLDDAVRGRVVDLGSVPKEILAILGQTHSDRIARMVGDMVTSSRLEEKRQIRMSDEVLDALIALRDFLYETVYERPEIRGEFEKAQRIIAELWGYFHAHGDEFRAKHWPKGVPESDGLPRAIADFITGMTDRYAMRIYEEYFLPKRWTVL
jgi:dGTPase